MMDLSASEASEYDSGGETDCSESESEGAKDVAGDRVGRLGERLLARPLRLPDRVLTRRARLRHRRSWVLGEVPAIRRSAHASATIEP